jgi:hypothetical protein
LASLFGDRMSVLIGFSYQMSTDGGQPHSKW